MIINGITFTVEGTGGGCTAAVAYVNGGAIVVTDGNLGTAFDTTDEHGEPCVAGWYPANTWHEQDEATYYGEGPTADAAVAALQQAQHDWDLEQQHGWGVCDHDCCTACQ